MLPDMNPRFMEAADNTNRSDKGLLLVTFTFSCFMFIFLIHPQMIFISFQTIDAANRAVNSPETGDAKSVINADSI